MLLLSNVLYSSTNVKGQYVVSGKQGMTDRRSFDRDRRSFFRDREVIADLALRKRSQQDRNCEN